MSIRTVVAVSGGPQTRLGRLVLAGEVVDAEPIMPDELRVMDDYVLSIVLDGTGSYRDAEGREERLVAGAHTIVPPGVPHWYGTAPGVRWTELFVVFTGPVFDSVAHLVGLDVAGPRYPRPSPSIEALRTVLRTPPPSRRAAEHQLFALVDWLLDAQDTDRRHSDRWRHTGQGGDLQPAGGGGAPTENGNPTTPTPLPSDPDLSPEVAHGVERLGEDLTAALDLATLAAETGLTYDTFRRRFTAEVGRSPSAFRTARRLQTAATLLRLTGMTHREIARTLGFADEFHFSRRFRAHFGVTPRDYRSPDNSRRLP